MNYEPTARRHEESRMQRRKSSHERINSDEIKQAIEQVKKEEKHQDNLVEQQKTMKDESPPQQLKTETSEETIAHEEKMLEKLGKLRFMKIDVDQSHVAKSYKVTEEIKAKVPRVDNTTNGTNQSREDFLKLKREQIGKEAATSQAKLSKELADIKAQGNGDRSNITKKQAHVSGLSGDIPVLDSQDNNKKKKAFTGDLEDDQDSKPPKPQKRVDDGSGNVYDQLSYTQTIDYDNKSSDQTEKVSWSEPSEKVSEISKDNSNVSSSKGGERLQFADVMHRAKLFLSKKEMARENNQISLMVQNLQKYQEAYNKGEEVSIDHFHTAIRELNESLQEREQGKFREDIENRRGQTGRQSQQAEQQQVIMEQQQQKASGPSGSVGRKIEQKIKKSEKGGSRGKSS